ncbi:LacI family DNA-binding transcriptional regulator [Treponema sp.]
MKIATVRDVAALAGVSTATVSRALDPGYTEKVASETRERVLAAAVKLNYKANHVARSLKTRSTRTIAILAPELSNDFFMELAEGMEKELDASGYMLLVASSANSQIEEKKRLKVLAERLVDGIVVIPAGPRGEHLQELADSGTPIVLVDRLVEGADLDAVLSGNEEGAFELTRELLSDGFRRITFMGGDLSISTAKERLAGFTRALSEAGIEAKEEMIRLGGMGIEDGYKRMDELLSSVNQSEALFAVNLLVHLGIQRRLQDQRDARFAIAGFDETPYSPFLQSCRYTAAQDAAGLGAVAARLVLERIVQRSSGENIHTEKRVVRLATRLIRHQSG